MAAILTNSTQLRSAANSDRQPRPFSLIRRVALRLADARQRKADRDVAEILARRGGVMQGRQSRLRAFPFHSLPALDRR